MDCDPRSHRLPERVAERPQELKLTADIRRTILGAIPPHRRAALERRATRAQSVRARPAEGMRQPIDQMASGKAKNGNAPQCTPKNSSGNPTMLSKNAPLAETNHSPLQSLNRLESPTKLVLNRAFQVATNKILSGRKLRCCLAAVCASGTQCLVARHLAWRGRCPNMVICALCRYKR